MLPPVGSVPSTYGCTGATLKLQASRLDPEAARRCALTACAPDPCAAPDSLAAPWQAARAAVNPFFLSALPSRRLPWVRLLLAAIVAHLISLRIGGISRKFPRLL